MDNFVVKAIFLLALPTVILFGGDYLMGSLSGRQLVAQRFQVNSKDGIGLGLRICGYDLAAVGRRWDALDPETRKHERLGLELDLIFPFFYGGGLATALLLGWAALNRPFHPAWLMAPIAIMMVADWIENLVQLTQLRLFDASGGAGLQSGWIQIASVATTTKLVFYCGSSLLLFGLSVWIVVGGVARRS
jgi:hypothetical protein